MHALLLAAALMVGTQPVHQSAPYRWVKHTPTGSQLDLMLGKRQVGAFDPERGIYLPLLDAKKDTWGDPCVPPIPVPAEYLPETVRTMGNDYGVERLDELPRVETVLRQGLECGKDCLLRALEERMPNDTEKPWLVVVGSEEQRRRVLLDVEKADKESPEKLDVRTWEVTAGHWSLGESDGGPSLYAAQVDPTVYLQAADGKVLHRQEGWGGPADLEAIRKARKGYDPAKDRDWRKLLPWNWFPAINPFAVVGVAGGLLLLLKKGQGEA